MKSLHAYRLAIIAAAVLCAPALSAKAPKPSNGLTMRNGETWIFTIDNGQPTAARRVTQNAAPAQGEIMASLTQMMGSTLKMTSNATSWLNYRALINGKRTSVCTLMNQGRMAFENWPYMVKAITISNFTPAPEGQMKCQ